MYDKQAVKRVFTIGDWTMRYYPPATKCKLDSPWLGLIPFVSNRAGAYGRLLLATHEHIITGGLTACDWFTPVTRGAWRVAPPISVVEQADVS